MESENAKRAAERRKKILENGEERLRRIAALSGQSPPPVGKSSTADGFVDFEVDSFVNEFQRTTPSSSPSSAERPSSTEADDRLRDEFPPFAGQSHQFYNRSSDSGVFAFPHRSHMVPPNDGRMNFQENPFLNMPPFGGMTSSPADLSQLMNMLTNLTSNGGPSPVPQQQQTTREEIHPVLNPVLNMFIFLILGIISRIFFQYSTLKINVFAPFMCLAIPLTIMSWGRGRPQPAGLLSALLMFVGNSRAKAFIVNWVRLTTLIRGVFRLFACYFFTFVLTHAVFEVSSISYDIDENVQTFE